MTAINMRYGGNVVQLPEGSNYSPQNYGTARLKYRVNSTSVGELGLTTNTNAKEYCGFQVRIGGRIAYIGRITNGSYVSGQDCDYRGYTSVSRSTSEVVGSEVLTSTATRDMTINTVYMSTTTSKFVNRTTTGNYGTNSGTSGADPTIRTITNSTGSSATTRTLSGTYQTPVYSYSRRVTTYNSIRWYCNASTLGLNLQRTSATGSVTYATNSKYINSVSGYQTISSSANGSSATANKSFSFNTISGNLYTDPTQISNVHTVAYPKATFKGYYASKATQSFGVDLTMQLTTYSPTTQYVHHYNTNTRWSYTMTSCKILEDIDMVATTVSGTYTRVSEIVHNMNI